MQTEKPTVHPDSQVVAAVRGGDAERYRELVERHERRVYAVAWSRLGDPHLAEEATQEAFIRGFRYLRMLGDGSKFAAWISSIARNGAVNLGLRHRRELNKRQRWALEQAPGGQDAAELCAPETLRQTLAELPAAPRECLVLFYLEGKSGAEAAATLGISEATFRVRLHRAKAELREQLESKLEGSLEKLRPGKSLVPIVMAVVLTSSSAKAATGGTIAMGVGAKIGSVFSKGFFFAWLLPLFSVIANVPSLIVLSIIARKERQNFRDADGFRPELHRRFFRSFMWGFPLLLLAVAVFNLSAISAWGIETHYFLLAAFLLALTLIASRSLTIARNPYQISMFAYCVIITAGASASALGWLPQNLSQLPIFAATALFLAFFHKRPTRMDYSLFLRAAHEQIKAPDVINTAPQTDQIDRRALLEFARFLGARFLASNFRSETTGLRLRLMPVGNRFLTNMATVFMPPITRNCSHILLNLDGTVAAHCGKTDSKDLFALKTVQVANPRELERIVAAAVGEAWQEFRRGNPTRAERMLGETLESDVFNVPPARAKSMRWWRIFLCGALILMLASMALQCCHPVWLSGLKPVSVTEADVRVFVGNIRTNAKPNRPPINDPTVALINCLALPSTNFFTPESLSAARLEVLRAVGFNSRTSKSELLKGFRNDRWLLYSSMTAGWINWKDLGVEPAEVNTFLHSVGQDQLHFLLSERRAWSWVKNESFNTQQIDHSGLNRLRWLRRIDCLDLIKRDELIQQVASVQVLSAANAPGNPPIPNWRNVRGLFHTPGWPTLQDTYFSVAALEILGGLDRIDRQACIQGILNQHSSKGYFTSPSSGGYNEYKIEGDARDTFCAFETLRILGGLDRVKDLEKWQFRPHRYRDAKDQLTWNDIEAWICQQRFAQMLRDRKENPKAPVRSLLIP